MKKTILLILSLCMGLSAYAQDKFEKGYIIQNNGTKTECWIQNNDWRESPTNFKYKLEEGSTIMTGNLQGIKEFSVGSSQKYQRFTVDIDRSSKRLQEISATRVPEFKSETLFLRVLIDGEKANLYSYIDGDLRRYFYTTPSTEVTQLIFKMYKSENGGLRKNEAYKSQLKDNLPCASANQDAAYTRSSLIKYFVAYNNCSGADASLTNYTIKETKGKFQIKAKGGINYFNVDARDTGVVFGDGNASSGSKVNPRIAIEFEYLFPLNNNRWAMFAEIAFQTFSGETGFFLGGTGNNTVISDIPVEYNHIEIPLGLRYYFPLKNSNQVFVNAGYTLNFPLDATYGADELSTSGNGFFGIGYEFNKVYGLEIRYSLARELFRDSTRFEVDYSGITLQFSYTLL